MKRKSDIVLMAIMLVSLLCTVANAESAATSSKPREIIFCHALPAQSPAANVFKRWGTMIEERSGGRVKFVYYWSNSLLPSAEAIRGVKVGTADVTASFSATEKYMPLTYNIMYMPFMGYPSMSIGVKIYEELYRKFPALQDEFTGLKRLASRTYVPVQIHTAKKIVKTPSDVKGMKIAITTAGKLAKLVDKLGGAPVHVHVADINMALNTGVVEGWFDFWPAIKVFGAIPMLPYHTLLGEGGISMALESLIMNPRTFNSLPPDIQQIFEEASAWFVQASMKADEGEVETAEKMARDLNQTFTYLNPEEIKLWKDAAMSLHQEWIEEMEAKGKPARALYEEAQRLIKEYSK